MHHRFFGLIAFGLVILASSLGNLHSQPLAPIAIAAEPTRVVYLPIIVREGALGCTTTQLIQDTSFEAGEPNPYWQVSSNTSSSILDNSTIPPPKPTHTGTWKAWLGGNNSMQENLWQSFSLASSAFTLQVSFWWQVNTAESTPLVNDSLRIQLADSNGTVLQTLYTLYDGDVNLTWVQQTILVSPLYTGQTLRIVFLANTDESNPTSFFIDDVSVLACQ
ncbi:MAG: hypothetical protein HZB51_16655 [Chloroflexi bacterium]|nr:hypothetical protein [Chloroflexota bacterium]